MSKSKFKGRVTVILPQFRKTMLGALLPAETVEKLYMRYGKPKAELSSDMQSRDSKGHFLPKVKILQY